MQREPPICDNFQDYHSTLSRRMPPEYPSPGSLRCRSSSEENAPPSCRGWGTKASSSDCLKVTCIMGLIQHNDANQRLAISIL